MQVIHIFAEINYFISSLIETAKAPNAYSSLIWFGHGGGKVEREPN